MTSPGKTDVSRETSEALEHLAELVRKWNPKINLIAPSTLNDLRTRHIDDSVAVSNAGPADATTWVDLGAGGGFPGLVVSILRPDTHVTLVESDKRKAQFLRTVRRELSLNAEVLVDRIEQLEPQNADVVSARALAPLPLLLAFGSRHCRSGGTCLFPKGHSWTSELADAQGDWSFDCEPADGSSGSSGKILIIKNIRPRHRSETNN